jgi:hypothetical protein
MLPEELGSQFLMKLQENGESYYLMKGKQYMDRMISLLRCFYKSFEIALEDYPPPAERAGCRYNHAQTSPATQCKER